MSEVFSEQAEIVKGQRRITSEKCFVGFNVGATGCACISPRHKMIFQVAIRMTAARQPMVALKRGLKNEYIPRLSPQPERRANLLFLTVNNDNGSTTKAKHT